MSELLEILAKALVENPDQVRVTQTETDRCINLFLRVAPEDMGRVIGRQGKIARALRALVRAAAVKDGRKVNVDIDTEQ